MWRATIKGLLGHKLRMALTGVAIVLGVAFVTGTYVLTDTLTAFFNSVSEEGNRGTDAIVRPGESGPRTLPVSMVADVARVPGVAAAEGGVFGYAQLTDKSGSPIGGQGPPNLGFSWGKEARLSPLRLKSGRAPAGPGEVVIDAVSARNKHLALGDSMKVLLVGPAETFRIVGITGFGRTDNLGGATIAAFDLETAARVLGTPGRVDGVSVAASPGVSNRDLLSRLRRAMPAGLEVVSGKTATQEMASEFNRAIGFISTAVLFFAGIALFVGSFIVANTFSIVINQRARELGLLRALGATGGQVMRSVLAEAAIVGLAASVVGFGVGLLLGAGLRALVQTISGGASLPGANIRVEPRTVIVSLLVGVVVTLVAAIVPARRGARLSPVAAMRELPDEAAITTRRHVIAGVVAAAGAGLFVTGLFGRSIPGHWWLVGIGAIATFMGLARVSPLAARPIAGILGSPLPRVAGLAGTLARANAGRNPRRTAATAAALMIGLALVGAVAIMAASLRSSLDSVLGATLKAEYVAGGRAMQDDTGFSPAVVERLRAIPGVKSAVGLRHETWRLGDKKFGLTAVDPEGIDDVLDLDVKTGSTAVLRDGGVLVGAGEADARHLRVGDTLSMSIAGSEPIPVRVGGTFARRNVIGDAYVVSVATYRRAQVQERVVTVLIKASDDASAAVLRDGFAKIQAEFPNVQVQSQRAFADAQKNNVRQIVAIVNALLALAILIALLGIANTLALSIFERTRELGLLRAVGMTKRQMRRMIRWESVIIAVFGALLGVGLGLLLGIAIVKSLSSSGLSELVVPARQLVLLVVIAGLAGTVSAAFPARRAARVDILRAVAFE